MWLVFHHFVKIEQWATAGWMWSTGKAHMQIKMDRREHVYARERESVCAGPLWQNNWTTFSVRFLSSNWRHATRETVCLCAHVYAAPFVFVRTHACVWAASTWHKHVFVCAWIKKGLNTDVQTCKRLSIQLCRYSVSHCVAIKAQWQRKEQKHVQERLI